MLEKERGPAEREEPKQGKQPRQLIALAHPSLGGSAVRNGEVSPVQRARGEPLRRGGGLGGSGGVLGGGGAHLASWCRARSERSSFRRAGALSADARLDVFAEAADYHAENTPKQV